MEWLRKVRRVGRKKALAALSNIAARDGLEGLGTVCNDMEPQRRRTTGGRRRASSATKLH
jgi:hypothetical protein